MRTVIDGSDVVEVLAESPAVVKAERPCAAPASIPAIEIVEGRYVVRFARTGEEIDAALRLRFEVFNLEMGEGLAASFATGRDRDEFDEVCHHLIVIDNEKRQIVGTYRCQTAEMAAARGFYSAGEFELSGLTAEVLADAVELGRACVARSHRNARVLFLLWRGLAAYVAASRKRYLFGCCSLTSQDEREGQRVFQTVQADGCLHSRLRVLPRAGFECAANEAGGDPAAEVHIPKLFRIYLRFGARVCGPPAIDRQFKTIDFLVLFDMEEMGEPWRNLFFGA